MKFKAGNIFVVLVLFWAGCGKEPDYSIVPEIALPANGLKFIESTPPETSEALRISLRFTDGDGDLGLDEKENKGKFAQRYYTIYYAEYTTDKIDEDPYSLKTWVPIQNGYDSHRCVNYQGKLWISTADNNTKMPGYSSNWREFFILNYKAKRTIPALHSFPEFVKPYKCTKWDVVTYTVDKAEKKDTVSVEYNSNYYNIFAQLYTKNLDGTFTLFDPLTYYGNCGGEEFGYGRFPVLAKDIDNAGALNGVINYSIRSSALSIIFGNKTMKLKVYILDREGHKSNVVETQEFTLQSIKGG